METSYQSEIQKRVVPLQGLSSLEPLIERIRNKKVVMLGESSHGTHEFYDWRRKISLELLKNQDFDFIAVEGDWPPCEEVNRFIQGSTVLDPDKTLHAFDRWPTWMWANEEIRELMVELKSLNLSRLRKVGFHGLDVYSLFDSLDVVVRNARAIDPVLGKMVTDLYSCFDPFKKDEMRYARSLFSYPAGCEEEVVNALEALLAERLSLSPHGLLFDSIQNARVVKNAERYYRAMIRADDSWNLRDRHMMETLEGLFEHYGPEAKGIVWEHNTHIGDYRATSMIHDGDVNIGGLARESFGEDKVALVGFTTYKGTVIASKAWDGKIQTLDVPESPFESIEGIFHDLVPKVGTADYYITLDDAAKNSALKTFRGHRAIGVVYHPHFEHGNYVPTSLANRYDAFVFLDETHALKPLDVRSNKEKFPETYPFGNKA